jgi:hypothetical protein
MARRARRRTGNDVDQAVALAAPLHGAAAQHGQVRRRQALPAARVRHLLEHALDQLRLGGAVAAAHLPRARQPRSDQG